MKGTFTGKTGNNCKHIMALQCWRQCEGFFYVSFCLFSYV